MVDPRPDLVDIREVTEEDLLTKQFDLMHLIVTNGCNQSCQHCLTESGQGLFKPKELNTQEFKDIVFLLNKMKIKDFHIEGGEPLIRKDICEILDGFDTLKNHTLITNGLVPWRKEFKLFVDKEIDSIMFSMDNFARPERGQYENLIERIKEYQSHGVRVKIRTTINKNNIDFMRTIITLALELGIDTVRFGTYKPLGFGAKPEMIKKWALELEDYKKLFDEFEKLIEEYKDKLTIKLSVVGSRNHFDEQRNSYDLYELAKNRPMEKYAKLLTCYALKKRFTVWSDGKVGPCNEMIGFYTLGDIRKDSLHKILSNIDKYRSCHSCNQGHLVISSDKKSHDMQ